MIGDGDVAAIMSSGDFDEQAVFTITPAIPPSTPAVTLTIRGWFTGRTDATTLFGQVQIEASNPTLVCETAAIATVKPKMNVLINSINYIVEKIEKVGTGLSVVYLKTLTT